MFELKPYETIIKKHFAALINNYNLTLKFNDHIVEMNGEKVLIQITTGYYYMDLQIVFIDKNNIFKEVTIGEVLEKKNLIGKKIIPDTEIYIGNNIMDELERELYWFSYIINKYCQDLLTGEFFND